MINRRSAIAIVAAAGAAFGLAACSSQGPSPVGTTQWQVTTIFQDESTPSQLPETQEGRAFLVFGEDSLTGASGCFSIGGAVAWDEREKQLSVRNVELSEINADDANCVASDERNAHRIKDVLDGHTLSYAQPDDRTLRLQVVEPEYEHWQTAPSLTMISNE